MRGTVHGRLGAVLSLAMFAALATSADMDAEAAGRLRAAPAGDHNRIGVGRHNVNSATIRSPSRVSGYQTVADTNSASVVSRNNAICIRHRRCRIVQRSRVR